MGEFSALGIDAGGTATRWTLVAPDGTMRGAGEAPPFSGHVFTETARENVRAALAAIAAALPAGAPPARVVAGITGLPGGSAETGFFVTAIAEAIGMPADAVTVLDDLAIAYRARFRPGEGILVYAGTGSVAFHLAATGEAVRAGGYGAVVDDGGSAYWIAVRALRAVLRMEDAQAGSGWATIRGRALGAAIGSTVWSDVRAFVYGGDRGTIGLLAREVARAASAGDTVARDILRDAGRELARLALVLRGRVGPLPLALAGGATKLHPAVAETFAATLGDIAFTQNEIDASLAAARLGAEAMHEA